MERLALAVSVASGQPAPRRYLSLKSHGAEEEPIARAVLRLVDVDAIAALDVARDVAAAGGGDRELAGLGLVGEAADPPLAAFELAHDIAAPAVVVLNAHVGS